MDNLGSEIHLIRADIMQTVSFTQAQQNLEAVCEQVWQNQEPCLIARDSHAVILLSQQEYNSLIETQYLLSQSNNANRLLYSLQQARDGNVFERELLEE
jgi:antitoxin YefM